MYSKLILISYLTLLNIVGNKKRVTMIYFYNNSLHIIFYFLLILVFFFFFITEYPNFPIASLDNEKYSPCE